MYAMLDMGKPWEYNKDPGSIPTIPDKVTVTHLLRSNEKHCEARQNFENSATMDEALNRQVIETIEDTYIVELQNKYTGFMGINTIDLFQHKMYIYG